MDAKPFESLMVIYIYYGLATELKLWPFKNALFNAGLPSIFIVLSPLHKAFNPG